MGRCARSPRQFGMYLPGHWYRLGLDRARIPWDDPVARLDVSLLANELIEPLLGIVDQRRDERIDFVGGIRGLGALSARVDGGDWAVAFSLFPTGMQDLMAVADVGGGDAAEIHLVRAQAGGWAGEPRARLGPRTEGRGLGSQKHLSNGATWHRDRDLRYP